MSYRKVLEAWQERHIDDVVKFFYSGVTVSPEARVFGSVYEKLAQGLVDKGVACMGNPFRAKAKTTDHIQFWVDETFKEDAEKFESTPVAAFVMLFVKTKNGNVGAVYKRTFVAPGAEVLRNSELRLALEDEAFNIRFDMATKVRSKPKKK